MSNDAAAVEAVVDAELGAVKELDEDVFAYILGIVQDVESHGCDPETLAETVRWEARNAVVAAHSRKLALGTLSGAEFYLAA